MCLIEDEQIDLLHPDKGMSQTLLKNRRSADNNHVVLETLLPEFDLEGVIRMHIARPRCDFLT